MVIYIKNIYFTYHTYVFLDIQLVSPSGEQDKAVALTLFYIGVDNAIHLLQKMLDSVSFRFQQSLTLYRLTGWPIVLYI